METRYCPKCNQQRPRSGFYAKGTCSRCSKRMPKTFIITAYCYQKSNARVRNMELPTYTVEELRTWLITKTNFKELYLNWKRSGYETNLKPSVDRIDENISYTLDNIQLMTWSENKAKGERDSKEGKRYSKVKSVTCLDLETEEFISQYYSLHEADRQTNIKYNTIWSACSLTKRRNGILGKGKQYKWAFTLDYMNIMVQQISEIQNIDLQTKEIKPSQIHYNEGTCLVSIH